MVDRNAIRVVHDPELHLHEIDYDYLVIVWGSTTNSYGISGLEDKAVAIKSLGMRFTCAISD
jgi:NADH dehydrogenase FAD-containing subunit